MLDKRIVCEITNDEVNFTLVAEEREFDLEAYDVLVKVYACGVSPIDKKLLKKFWQNEESKIPIGYEISGTVIQVGNSVKRFEPDDEVSGIVPLSNQIGGIARFCVVTEFDLVKKPLKVSHIDAACGISDALKAYTSLHYQARVTSSETVVIQGASKGQGILAIQLAQYLGVKVIATGSTDEEMIFLKSLEPLPDQIVDLRNTRRNLITVCMEETGGIGVDCVIDDKVELYPNETDMSASRKLSTKHDIISCLAVGGRWITNQNNLQIDPPESEMLSLKCASIHYLFEQAWSLSKGSVGRYLHLLEDIMCKMEEGILRPMVHHTVLFDDCIKSLVNADQNNVGKVVVKII